MDYTNAFLSQPRDFPAGIDRVLVNWSKPRSIQVGKSTDINWGERWIDKDDIRSAIEAR
jgi:hypothetical protein